MEWLKDKWEDYTAARSRALSEGKDKPKKLEDMSKEELVAIIKKQQQEIEELKRQIKQLLGQCNIPQQYITKVERVKDAQLRLPIY